MILLRTGDIYSRPPGPCHPRGRGSVLLLRPPPTTPATRYVRDPRRPSASAVRSPVGQIHVYGGHRPDDTGVEAIVDNYYILSLPQFIWTRAPSLAQPAIVSRCDRLGTHRMVITVGLRDPHADCLALLKILDLNTGMMVTTFADTVGYMVPRYVVADIGGGYVGPLFALLTD